MKKITRFGFLAFASVLLLATACKKSPSCKLYNTCKLESVEMPDADSVTLAALNEQGVEFTFKKGGEFTMSGAISGNGTFEINEEGTSMSTTVDGNTDMYDVSLTESALQLSEGTEKMTFTVKK